MEINNSFLEFFLESRRNAAKTALAEKAKTQDWGFKDATIEDYDRFFQGVLGYVDLTYFLERKKTSGHAYAMDLMGHGHFYREVELDGELAVSLSDLRDRN